MRLAGSTSSGLLSVSHATGTTASASTVVHSVRRAFRFVEVMIAESRVEGLSGTLPIHIDAEHPLRELRVSCLLERTEVSTASAAEEEGFGFQARVVGPRFQIAPCQRDDGAVEAAKTRAERGEHVREAHLSQLRVTGIVQIVVDDLSVRLQPGNLLRIEFQREEILAAADEYLAARAHVTVDLDEIALEVEQPVKSELLPQRDRVAERSFTARKRPADEYLGRVVRSVVGQVGTGADHLTALRVVAEDVLDVRTAVREQHRTDHPLLEVGTDRVTDLVFYERAADDEVRRPGQLSEIQNSLRCAEALDLAVVRRVADGHVPLKRISQHGCCAHQYLASPVLDRAGIERLRVGKSKRRSDDAIENRVGGSLSVVRELDAEPVVESTQVEACLDLLAALGAKVCVADELRSDGCNIAGPRGSGVRLKRRVGDGLLPGLAVRCAKLERVDRPEARPERLFAYHPRRAELRVVNAVEVLAKGTVVVRSDGGGQENPVAEAHLLLHEEAKSRVFLRVARRYPVRRRRRQCRQADRWKYLPGRRLECGTVAVILRAEGRRGLERIVDVPDSGRRIIESIVVDLPVVDRPVALSAGAENHLAEGVFGPQTETVVALVGTVGTTVQTVPEPAVRLVVQ